MTTFLDALKAQANLTYTENGAVTNKSSLDAVVDFFSLAGAMRDNPEGAADLLEKAYIQDPLTAVRTLFYLRDIRGGQGERDVFRAGLKRLAQQPVDDDAINGDDAVARFRDNILRMVPEYGRWDDLWSIGVTPSVVAIVHDQLKVDLLNYAASPTEPVSLLAKWLPSENTSSRATRALAKELRSRLGYTPAEYRRILSKLRRRIHLLEQDMSTNNWGEIDFGKLPGQAHRKHVKAFFRHQPERYRAFLDSAQKGESKINVSTLYPHEIYNAVQSGLGPYASAAWENLPDYTNGRNALVMADTSGSMVRPRQSNNPIAVSVSLALYFAERNTGAFRNYFMTFSEEPELVQVVGNDLPSKMGNIASSRWGMNTDLLKAFRAILAAATRAGDAPPDVLYVISDMEFDAAQPRVQAPSTSTGRYKREFRRHPLGYMEYRDVWMPDPTPAPQARDTIFRVAKAEFEAAGYQLPHVVFWNVNARNMQAPATVQDGHVSLVSGLSPTVFGMAVEGKTPLELVHSVVNSERYSRIVL